MGAYLSEEESHGQATKHWGYLVVLGVSLRARAGVQSSTVGQHL